MEDVTSHRLTSAIAAGLGGLSWLVLPWITATLTSVSGGYQTAGLNGAGVFYLLLIAADPRSPAGPELAAWKAILGPGFLLFVVGSVLYLAGCLTTAVEIVTRLGVGGPLMMAGTLVNFAAVLPARRTYVLTGGYGLIVESDVGLYLGLAAALVSLASLVLWGEEAELRGAEAPGEWLANRFWLHRAAEEMTPGSAIAPTGVPERRTRSYCPTCGRGYYTDARACVVDGTPLRAVPIQAASTSDAPLGPSPDGR